MAANYDGLLPTQSEAIVDARGVITRKFRDFLAQFADSNNAALQAQVDALAAEVAELAAGSWDLATFIQGVGISIVGQITDPTIRISLNAYLGQLIDVDLVTTPPADGDALIYDAALGKWIAGAVSPPRILPLVTGDIDAGQPVFVYADDGSLIYTEIE